MKSTICFGAVIVLLILGFMTPVLSQQSGGVPWVDSYSQGSCMMAVNGPNGPHLQPCAAGYFGPTSTFKMSLAGQTTGGGTQWVNKYNQTLYTLTALNPSTSGLSGSQPTLFNAFMQDSGISFTNALYGMLISNNATGTAPNRIGIEGDVFHSGAGSVTNLIGNSGFAEQDAGTVSQIISIAAGGGAITAGTATAIISVLAGAPTQTGGTVQFARGVEIANQGGIGATGNAGLWIDAQSGAGARAIFVAGSGIVDFAASTYMLHPTVAFASLPASPVAGESIYCTNCTTAPTCVGGGTGHMAVYNGTAWTCQ